MKIFISHSSKDKRFVRTLKTDLNENGFDTFFDEDSLELGDSLKERLELALDESSHFLIILSPHSVTSDWVKFELFEALKLFDENTLKKIIPVRLRNCETPKELQNLLYADLADEIFQINGDKLKFHTTGYGSFLVKLIRTINSSEKRLNKKDLTELKKEVNETDKKLQKKQSETITQRHQVIKYKDFNTVQFYQKKIAEAKKTTQVTQFRPIKLPKIYSLLFKDIKLGDVIKFMIDSENSVEGHFAGYRGDDNSIAIHSQIRKLLKVEHGIYYNFQINISEKAFKVSQ
jgi:TIR domain